MVMFLLSAYKILAFNQYYFTKNHSDCTESSLIMFMDGVEEFYKCLLDKVNHVITTEDKDLNVSKCINICLVMEIKKYKFYYLFRELLMSSHWKKPTWL